MKFRDLNSIISSRVICQLPCMEFVSCTFVIFPCNWLVGEVTGTTTWRKTRICELCPRNITYMLI